MSHEIRTPLNGVIGMASALKKTPLSADQSEMLSVISSAGSHLLDLLTDVLQLAKIEAGENECPYEALDPDTLVKECAALLETDAAAKNLTLSCNTNCKTNEGLMGNTKRIRQVLVNLTSNAIKFTDQGSISIYAELAEPTPNTTELRVRVQDTGRGVPDSQKEQIFDRFNQGEHTEDLHLGGIGLGLAISSAICRVHGGNLKVEDTPGGGATFTASFVLKKGTNNAVTFETLSSDYTLPKPTSMIRILVAEDNVMNQRVLKALFREQPVELVIVSDGEQALQKLSEESFDSALIDVRMPIMGGMECVRRYRDVENGEKRLPIVSCSANVMTEQIEAYDAAGFDWHLPKPIDDHAVDKYMSWLSKNQR